MAMFNLKDSEDIKIDGCKTNSSTLVEGEALKRIEVKDSFAVTPPAKSVESPKRTFLSLLTEHLVPVILGIPVALLVAYLIWRFGWTS